MVFKVLLFAYLLQLQQYVDAWSIVTSRPVEQPEPRLMTLEEVYDSQDVYRLSDETVGLTAFKDKKLLSCFVNDYDPYWKPEQDDRMYFTANKPCEKVNLTTDYKTLKKKTGPKIAGMCKELYIFWLAARDMVPPPLPGMVSQQSTQPCRIKYDDELDQIKSRTAVSGQTFGNEPSPARVNIPSETELGEPPMLRDGAPSEKSDSPPSMPEDGAPPLIHDGAPPLLQGGAPPRLQDKAPPMFYEGAPPVLHDGPPPMSREGAPPMLRDTEMGPPPLLQNTHARRDLDAPPMVKTPPPLNPLVALTAQTSRVKAGEKIPTMASVWRKMLSQIENTNTIAPPIPDVKTPPPPPGLFRKNM